MLASIRLPSQAGFIFASWQHVVLPSVRLCCVTFAVINIHCYCSQRLEEVGINFSVCVSAAISRTAKVNIFLLIFFGNLGGKGTIYL